MDINSLKRTLAKGQKFSNLLDGTSQEFAEFAEQFVGIVNESAKLLEENTSLKAKVAELEKSLATATATPKTYEQLKSEVLGPASKE